MDIIKQQNFEIFESMLFPFCCKDIKGKYIICNDAYAKLLNFKSKNDLIGKLENTLLSKKTAALLSKYDDEIIAKNSKKIFALEIDALPKAERLLVLKYPCNEFKKIKGVFSILISLDNEDIIENIRNACLDLQDVTQINGSSFLKNIIANLPGSIYWKDRNGVYLGCNNYVA
ncbi:MAG: hypothetical protein PVG30_00855 [Gammaproteobacteria bacterium]|jgi:hypothetical protein